MRPASPGSGVDLTEEEAAYALASLLAGADGVVTHAETRRVEGAWSRFAASRGLTPLQARAVATRCRGLRASLGPEHLLAACERTLATAQGGQDAVRLALDVAYADGRLAGPEKEHLARLLDLVGLDGKDLPGPLEGKKATEDHLGQGPGEAAQGRQGATGATGPRSAGR